MTESRSASAPGHSLLPLRQAALGRQRLPASGAAHMSRMSARTQGNGVTGGPALRCSIESPAVPPLGRDDPALHEPEASGIRQLRWSRHHGLRALARQGRLPAMARRHGRATRSGHDHRADRQRWQLRAGELPMGHAIRAEPQSAPRQAQASGSCSHPVALRRGQSCRRSGGRLRHDARVRDQARFAGAP